MPADRDYIDVDACDSLGAENTLRTREICQICSEPFTALSLAAKQAHYDQHFTDELPSK